MSKFNMYKYEISGTDLNYINKFIELYGSIKSKYNEYLKYKDDIEEIKERKKTTLEIIKTLETIKTKKNTKLKSVYEKKKRNYEELQRKYEELNGIIKYIKQTDLKKIYNQTILGLYKENGKLETYEQMYKKLENIIESYNRIEDYKNSKGLLNKLKYKRFIKQYHINNEEYKNNIDFYEEKKERVINFITTYNDPIEKTIAKLEEPIEINVINQQEIDYMLDRNTNRNVQIIKQIKALKAEKEGLLNNKEETKKYTKTA